MATVVNGNQVKLDNGQIITPQNGGWYNGQQYWNGSLGAPGVGNNPNQTDIYQKAAPTFNAADTAYIQKQQASFTPTPAPVASPTSQPSIPTATVTPATQGAQQSVFGPAPIDLAGTYNNLVSSSGIAAKDAEIAQKRQQQAQAVAAVNDNPFLSEATRVGRVAKINQLAEQTLGNLQNEVATKRADIEMQLNLQTKQFDLNSAQAQQNLSQFNDLLKMGALDNASPDDIANITRSTGLSSGIIANAINNRIRSGYQTETKSFDDGTNEGFIIYTIDQLGNVINQSKQVTGKSSKANQNLPYSTDPAVNSFITNMIKLNGSSGGTGNIDSLWVE